MSGRILLKRGKEKPLVNHHPWIFSGAIDRVVDVANGETADVFDEKGNWMARASYNGHSQIAARVWTFEKGQEVDRLFFEKRLSAAIKRRDEAIIGTDGGLGSRAYRVVNAESDGLPGLVVDKYGDFLVVQILTLGTELHKTEITALLFDLLRPRGIYERSDLEVRRKEGLTPLKGRLLGDDAPERIDITENGLHFWVDIKRGHKTGFYLDQRENRRRAAPFLFGEVLNAFSYSGAFGIYAARAGAGSVVNLDASASALDLAKDNFALNGWSSHASYILSDAFDRLRALRDEMKLFDAIILDPPKFVSSQGQMERGLRGYKDINLLAFDLLRPGGVLVTFSCSGLVGPELFQKVIFGAMRDARRDGQIVEKLGQAPDHPIALTMPEAEYLKGLIVRVC